MAEIRFYLDENVPTEVANQLTLSGIDAVSVRDLELLGDDDASHMERATSMERLLCTHDQDFLRLAAEGAKHAGIAFARQSRSSIGGWVRELRRLHAKYRSADVEDQVVFLNMGSG